MPNAFERVFSSAYPRINGFFAQRQSAGVAGGEENPFQRPATQLGGSPPQRTGLGPRHAVAPAIEIYALYLVVDIGMGGV